MYSPKTRLRFFLLATLSILLMFADHHRYHTQMIRHVLSIIITPLQYTAALPVGMVDWFEENIKTRQTLIDENDLLTKETLKLKADILQLHVIEKENQQLRALLHTASREKNRIAVAQLLAVSTEPFQHQVIIDKGSHDSVYVGQPVLDADGVYGQVIHVGKFTSHVLLLTDNRSAIPVQNTRNGVRAIAVGTGATHRLSLVNLPVTNHILEGDHFISSGLGQRFPTGYPVGSVATVNNDPSQMFAKIEIKPDAHLYTSRLLLLIWPQLSEKHIATH